MTYVVQMPVERNKQPSGNNQWRVLHDVTVSWASSISWGGQGKRATSTKILTYFYSFQNKSRLRLYKFKTESFSVLKAKWHPYLTCCQEIHSKLLVNYVCANCRTEYGIKIDKTTIKWMMMMGNSPKKFGDYAGETQADEFWWRMNDSRTINEVR